MATLAKISIPIRPAMVEMAALNPALMGDDQHVAKCTLVGAFGEGGIRPWRLLGDDGDDMLVVGWLSPRLSKADLARGLERLGATATYVEFKPERGQEIVLHVLATPQRNVRVPGVGPGPERPDAAPVAGAGRSARIHGQDKAKRLTRRVDVAEGAASVKEAYRDWLIGKIDCPRTGLDVTGEGVRITSTRHTQGIVRVGDRLRTVRMPQVEGAISVTVREPDTFESFLYRGVGPMAHVGYGMIVPGELAHAA